MEARPPGPHLTLPKWPMISANAKMIPVLTNQIA
jgi:hypothetical protein